MLSISLTPPVRSALLDLAQLAATQPGCPSYTGIVKKGASELAQPRTYIFYHPYTGFLA